MPAMRSEGSATGRAPSGVILLVLSLDRQRRCRRCGDIAVALVGAARATKAAADVQFTAKSKILADLSEPLTE
jgi:hypothetical protein